MMLGPCLALLLQAADDPAALIERFRSESPLERSEALVRLKALGAEAAPALEAAARDRDPEVAGQVRFLLRRIEAARRVTGNLRKLDPGLEDRLASGDPNAWTRALYELVDRRASSRLSRADLLPIVLPALRGARRESERLWVIGICEKFQCLEAIPELAGCLRGPPSALGEAALRALVGLNAVEAVDECLRRLREGPPEARAQAVGFLARIKGRALVPGLTALLRNPDAAVRRSAVRVLLEVGPAERPAAHEALTGVLSDADANVRAGAAEALGATGGRAAAPALARLLQGDQEGVRVAAVRALGRLEAVEQLPAVRGALKDVEESVRVEAVRALVWMRARQAGDALVDVLADPEAAVRIEALKALAELDLRDRGDAVAARLGDRGGEVRLAAGWAAGKLRAASARKALEAMLAEKSVPARLTAATALGRLRSEASAPALLARLADPNPIVKGAAAEALGGLPHEEAAGILRGLLKDPNAVVRAAAARSLGRLREAASADGLLALLADTTETEDVVFAVLGREEEQDCPEIEERLETDYGTVRGAAARALAVLGRREAIGPLLAEASDGWPVDLTPLNRFRDPEACAKLGSLKAGPGLSDVPAERLKEIARRSGFELEGEAANGRIVLTPFREGSLWDALLESSREGGFEVILEGNKIRAEGIRKVERFWEAWWEEQQKDR